VRHTNATIAFANVETTAEWQDERSTMEENLQRNGQRYGYPRGYFRLSSALETVWGRIWEEAYWGEKYDEDTNPDDFGFDEQQAAVAKGRAYDAMKYAWYAIKAICPGR
jgi:hypothetical protein